MDQASSGRVDLGLVAPASGLDEWEREARALLSAWHEWPLPDGRTLAASPGPAQAWLPRIVVGDAGEAADRLGAGVLTNLEDGARRAVDGRALANRARHRHSQPRIGRLAADVLGAILDLRARADNTNAHDLVVILGNHEPDRLEDDVRLLGVVVGTSLRCPAHKVEFLALDTWRRSTSSPTCTTSSPSAAVGTSDDRRPRREVGGPSVPITTAGPST